mmetsp:Transcript_40893/g.41587  ORF Transcript_40893/g.41587 Transcript_40893/m.41587 type:complete len:299 (-) Transcript_40893:170-1066(-)
MMQTTRCYQNTSLENWFLKTRSHLLKDILLTIVLIASTGFFRCFAVSAFCPHENNAKLSRATVKAFDCNDPCQLRRTQAGHENNYILTLRFSKDDKDKDKNSSDNNGKRIEKVEKNKMFLDDRKIVLPSNPLEYLEDIQLLLYDVFLLMNLSVSISFWVVHRMKFDIHLYTAFSEGSLLSLCWITAGLVNGAFLFSAVNGNVSGDEGLDSSDNNQVQSKLWLRFFENRNGPTGAGLLALRTFVGCANLRLCCALASSVLEHRKFGAVGGEDLIPLELGFGIILMSAWRYTHSQYAMRS